MANELPTSKLENQRLSTAEPTMAPTPVLTDSQYKIGVDPKAPNIIEEKKEKNKKIDFDETLIFLLKILKQGQEGTEGPDNVNDKDTNLPEKRSRGRPKKEVSNNVMEKSAKTRGRPKKDKLATITTGNDTNSSGKRRGRPKREEIKVTPGNTANSVVKRGRGRPKQSESNRVAGVLQKKTRGRPKKALSKPITTEKRRPGRPKATKLDVFDGPTKTDEDKITTSEKRGRGRPRKNPLLSQVGKSKIAPKRVTSDKISNGTPKPRGRPRKVVTDKEVDVSHPESETKLSSINVAIPVEVSTANEIQVESNLEQSTNSIQAPNAIQNDPVEPSNAIALNGQNGQETVNGEPPKKRGRPKRDDQTEQGLTKKVKA
ncbi:13091_t:CDS:2 [Dentiscutata erythropus]|uniref:13091_t:CDS:1 n=1 Tax=Dentiscutata erythropus TaxID=1348616 RepID=A0A9N9DQG8_9GLOM|nr:13091_t:CDS:2 [Dentiscutata erythropus]